MGCRAAKELDPGCPSCQEINSTQLDTKDPPQTAPACPAVQRPSAFLLAVSPVWVRCWVAGADPGRHHES